MGAPPIEHQPGAAEASHLELQLLSGLGRFSWQESGIFLRSQFQRLCRLRLVLANHHNWLPSFRFSNAAGKQNSNSS